MHAHGQTALAPQKSLLSHGPQIGSLEAVLHWSPQSPPSLMSLDSPFPGFQSYKIPPRVSVHASLSRRSERAKIFHMASVFLLYAPPVYTASTPGPKLGLGSRDNWGSSIPASTYPTKTSHSLFLLFYYGGRSGVHLPREGHAGMFQYKLQRPREVILVMHIFLRGETRCWILACGLRWSWFVHLW
jgi:hypothetical protein